MNNVASGSILESKHMNSAWGEFQGLKAALTSVTYARHGSLRHFSPRETHNAAISDQTPFLR